jgi:lincosamide and streptogramin A transport system ATP-binding/permease protein
MSDSDLNKNAVDLIGVWKPQIEVWQVLIQMNELKMDPECLYRPFGTLSFGERTRVMLAVLFAAENEFLLIDEPTNHLDTEAHDIVKEYLASKKGFILVSHDRDLLDKVCDHVLVLNRSTIEVQAGNFSSWWENKEKNDSFQQAENVRHLKEIGKLKAAADKSSRWADKNENSKIGFDPVKEHDRSIATRAFIGAKTKKMQARVKNYERRIYIWDEPLNYIDVFSRMQIENLILQYKPTMLLVEHDTRFQEKVASDIIKIGQAHYRDFV